MVNLISREELNEMKVAEIGNYLQQSVDKFKEILKEYSEIDNLKLLEEKLMVDMGDYDNYLKTVVYKLPTGVEFDGVFLSKSDIFNRIVSLLNKMEITWQYVPGLYHMSKLWRSDMSSIDYHKYDSTLSCLGQLKYKGYKEWSYIFSINTYLEEIQELYSRDTTYMIYLSQIHNAILDRMQQLNGVDPVTGEVTPTDMICEEGDNCDKDVKPTRKRKS